MLNKPGYKFDFESVKVKYSENNEKMRKVVAAIHIRMHQPGRNRWGATTYRQSTRSCFKEARGANRQRWANHLEAEGVTVFPRL